MKFRLTNQAKVGIVVLYTLAIAMVFSEAGYLYGKRNGAEYPVQGESVQTVAIEEEKVDLPLPEEAKYRVKRYGDGLAVYEGENMIKTVSVDFDMLRQEDRELLERGIDAETMQEVSQILEDYIS